VNSIRWYHTLTVADSVDAEYLLLREYAYRASGMQDGARAGRGASQRDLAAARR
jgi:hypothetical protein